MNRSQLSHNSQDTAALVFTNNVGQVIFVDQAFLTLLSYTETGIVAGEPLFKALRQEAKTVERLLDRLIKDGRVEGEVLAIPGKDSQPHHFVFDGIANYDQNKLYQGADITLREATRTPTGSLTPVVTSAVPTRQVSPEMASGETGIFIALYFTSQIKAIYVLLSRLMGVWTQANLDKIITETAAKAGHPIQVKNGLFASDLSAIDPATFRAILSKVLSYAVNIIGKRIVEREVAATDAKLHEGVLVLASQVGLRNLLGD